MTIEIALLISSSGLRCMRHYPFQLSNPVSEWLDIIFMKWHSIYVFIGVHGTDRSALGSIKAC
jgi:hypothetical protein